MNTLRISEDEFYYGLPIYHFHLDHKIGQPAPKDECQLNTCRMIFSIVPAALEAGAAPEHDSTVYLRRQPPHGFTKQEALHTYLKTRYPEVGLARGRQRPPAPELAPTLLADHLLGSDRSLSPADHRLACLLIGLHLLVSFLAGLLSAL